jgi:hypothetical protein
MLKANLNKKEEVIVCVLVAREQFLLLHVACASLFI